MPRSGGGVYSLPPGSTIANGDTSDASDLNTPLADIEADLNTVRPIVAGGTGASSAADARTNLGLVIGTNVQAYDADLASWAGVTRASGFDTFAATPNSANLRALLTDEVGTGAAYFVGGALGTPASGVLTNCTGLTTAGIAAATLVTESEGIGSNDNDTTIPTSAAVKDYVDSRGVAFTYSASQTTTSGTTRDFTGVPAGVNEVVVDLIGVSLTGTDNILIQPGTAGGPIVTGYTGAGSNTAASSASSTASTTGALVRVGSAVSLISGRVRLERLNGNLWHITGFLDYGSGAVGTIFLSQTVDLGAELTQVRVASSGANTFDAGSARIGWR